MQFGDIMPFLQNNTDIGPSLRPKMLAMLSDSRTLGLLKMELATMVDVGNVLYPEPIDWKEMVC